MKCPNCGKEIANDSVFCEFCGAKVETAMPSATRLNWLKWLGLICIAVGIVLALRFMLYAGWFEGLFWYLNSLSAWSEYVLSVIATIAVGGYSAYKVFDKKMSFTDKKAMFKRLFIWSSIIYALLILVVYISSFMSDYQWDLEGVFYSLLNLCYKGYGVVYVGVICLYIWQAKQITK